MNAPFARLSTLVYACTAALCVALPLVRPAGQRGGVFVAVLLGAPLAALAGLLAWLHRVLGLQAGFDVGISVAYSVAALLFVQPILYWLPETSEALLLAVPLAAAVAAVALVGLAIQAWQRARRRRLLLTVGVLLVADPFAWAVYTAFWGTAANIDVIGQLEEMFVSWGVAALVLGAGLFRQPTASAAG